MAALHRSRPPPTPLHLAQMSLIPVIVARIGKVKATTNLKYSTLVPEIISLGLGGAKNLAGKTRLTITIQTIAIDLKR